MTLGQIPLSNPDIVLYTDGSASLDPASAEWGVFTSRPQGTSASLWGPVITDCTDSDWIGALRPTNNTGEISAIYHVLRWVRGEDRPSSTVARRRINLLTDSEYCVRLIGDNSIKPRPSFSESGAFSPLSAGITTWPSPGSKPIRASPRPMRWVTPLHTASPPEAEQAHPERRCTPLRSTPALTGDVLLVA